MKKKALSIIIIAVLVLLTVFTLTACDGGKKKNDGKLVLKDGMTAAEIFAALTDANIDSMTVVTTYTKNQDGRVSIEKVNKTSYYEEDVYDGVTKYIDYSLYENGRCYEYRYNAESETNSEEIRIFDLDNNKLYKSKVDGVIRVMNHENILRICEIATIKNKDIDKDFDNEYSVKVENNNSIVFTDSQSVVVYKDFNATEVPLPEGMKGYDKMSKTEENARYEIEGDGARLEYIDAPILSYIVPSTVTFVEKDAENNDVTKTYDVIAADIDGDMMEYTLPTSVVRVNFDEDYTGQIIFKGTIAQWNSITIENYAYKTITVRCTDGDTTVSAPKGE